MQAALGLLSLGVDHRKLMGTLQNDTLEDLQKQSRILQSAERALGGEAAYVIVDQKRIGEEKISYSDIHPISGILRDCEDIRLGFTMYEEQPGLWRCSFRSDGTWVNVNALLTPFGGGGHAAAAGLRIETGDVEILLREILERVAMLRKIGG